MSLRLTLSSFVLSAALACGAETATVITADLGPVDRGGSGDTSEQPVDGSADSTGPGLADTAGPDAASEDAGITEDATEAPDLPGDAGTNDVADPPVDVAVPDTAAPPDVTTDVAVDDVPGPLDSGATGLDDVVADVGEPDVQEDTGSDAGPQTPDVSVPPFVASTCTKFVNTNVTGTVNPFISPARNGLFYVSWVEKGGNLKLTWESPIDCLTIEGPFQVNATDGAVYYWGGISVVSDLQGNFYAVWESSESGKDISFAWSETGMTFSDPVELVSTSTNGQDPALFVPSAGTVHAAWRGHHPSLPQYDTFYARANDVFAGGTFSPGLMINDDDQQDDQVAIVGDGKGKLYMAWQRFEGDIYATRSLDNGASWAALVLVNDVAGQANVGKATFMAITPAGRVVLAWSDDRKQKSGNENDVFADSSADGLTWGVDVQVNDDDARYQEDPSLAVATTGACKGAVYVVWQDFRNKSSYDIYASRSTDGGLTWSANVPIANDLEGDEMNPAIAVNTLCTVGVAWRDSKVNDNFDIGTSYISW